MTPTEQAFNASILKVTGDADANALRSDGLRLIPKVNGELYAPIPVVTVHTLGDLFVPISMQQIYRQRMESNGFGDMLVQRAVRSPGHCDFTATEFTQTFDAMIQWEQNGIKPAGDDLLNPALMNEASFGCTYTVNDGTQAVRAFMPTCPDA